MSGTNAGGVNYGFASRQSVANGQTLGRDRVGCPPQAGPAWAAKYGHLYLAAIFALAFATRHQPALAGVNVRPEYVLVAIGWLCLSVSGRIPRVTAVAGGGSLLAWIALNVASSVIGAPSLATSAKDALLLLAGVLTMVMVAYVGKRSLHDVVHWYLQILFVAILLGVIGTIVDVVTGSSYFSEIYEDVVVYRRTHGTFYEPNFYGISSMMLAVILLDDWERERKVAGSGSTLWRFAVCLVGVLISGTRSAQLTLVVGVVSVLVIRGRLTRRRVLTAFAGLVGGILVSTLLLTGVLRTSYTDRLIGTFTDPSSSATIIGRLGIMDTALEQVPDRLWVGHGTNTFGQFNPSLNPEGGVFSGRSGNYIGSMPVAVLYDTGILGALLVAAWLARYHLWAFSLSRRRGAPDRLWPLAVSSALMFVAFVSTSGIWLSFPWVHMGVTTALVFAGQTRGAARGRASPQTAASPVAALGGPS